LDYTHRNFGEYHIERYYFRYHRANMADASRTPDQTRSSGEYNEPGETPIAAGLATVRKPPATQASSFIEIPTLQEPIQGLTPTTPLVTVVTRLIADTPTQNEGHDLATIGSIQLDINETQLQGREVPPASWAAAKRDLTWTTTANLKSYLKLLSVVGVSNAVNKLKIDAVAARMRQHSILLRCLEDAEIARDMLAAAMANDYGDDIVVESPTQMQTDALAKLQTLPKVFARAEKSPTPGDCDLLLVWWKGDIPVMSADGTDVMACDSGGSSREEMMSVGVGAVRERAFTASDHARLMHVLCDARMTRARQLIMRPRDKDDLDRAPVCPWSDHVAPFFNDINFRPVAIEKFVDGICRDDLNAIDPSGLSVERTGGLLRRKWGELKSEYTIRVSQFEASGQGDSQDYSKFAGGNTYVMYLHCMVTEYALFESLAMRLLPADTRLESGISLDGNAHIGSSRHARGRKRANSEVSISISGLDKFTSAIAPSSPSQARRMERAESRKARSDAMASLLTALSQISKSISASNSSSERKLLTKKRRKMRYHLVKASADIGTSGDDSKDDDSEDDEDDNEIEPDERNGYLLVLGQVVIQ
jgi:hypothetical protein